MTDAQRERYVRRLRFPRELEQGYQADHYRRVLPTLRIGLMLSIAILAAQGVGWHSQGASFVQALVACGLRALPFAVALPRGCASAPS